MILPVSFFFHEVIPNLHLSINIKIFRVQEMGNSSTHCSFDNETCMFGTTIWSSVVGSTYEVTSEDLYIYKSETSDEMTIHPKKVKMYSDEGGHEYTHTLPVDCECLEGKSLLSHLKPGTKIKITHLSKNINIYGIRCSINESNYKNVRIDHMWCFFKFHRTMDSSRQLECLDSMMVEVED